MEVRLVAATEADMEDMAAMETMAEIPAVEQAVCVVICGVQIHCANVWEMICAHACKK